MHSSEVQAREASIKAFLAKYKGKCRIENAYRETRTWLTGLLQLFAKMDKAHVADIDILQLTVNNLQKEQHSLETKLNILLGFLDYCAYQSEKINNIPMGTLIENLVKELPKSINQQDVFKDTLDYLKNKGKYCRAKDKLKQYKKVGKHITFRSKLYTMAEVACQFSQNRKNLEATQVKSWLQEGLADLNEKPSTTKQKKTRPKKSRKQAEKVVGEPANTKDSKKCTFHVNPEMKKKMLKELELEQKFGIKRPKKGPSGPPPPASTGE